LETAYYQPSPHDRLALVLYYESSDAIFSEVLSFDPVERLRKLYKNESEEENEHGAGEILSKKSKMYDIDTCFWNILLTPF